MEGKTISIIPGELYAGYALDAALRKRVSSGGVVSAVLIDLLERGEIDGAVVSRITAQDGHLAAVSSVARTREEVLQHGGSSYVDTPVLQAVNALKDQPGRYAVVALPCQARALRSQMKRNPELREKFFPIIGLFCRGNVTETFYEDYFRRVGIDPAQVESVHVIRGHLQGDVVVRLHSGEERIIPFMTINSYRLAGIHPKALCAWCDEHTSEESDLAVGDIFMPEFKQRIVKRSAFVAHTPQAAALIERLEANGLLISEFVGRERYRQAFASIERFSNTLAPRYLAARISGVTAPRTRPPGRVNPFHVLAWVVLFINKRLSQSERGRCFLFALPPLLVKLTAYKVKALSRL